MLTELAADLSAAETVFAELVTAYGDPTRHYHNLEHIQDLLNGAESVQNLAESMPVIKLAIWFHDYIYDPQAQDNELKSAIYAEQVLTQLNVDSQIIQLVKQIILSTQKHQPLVNTVDNLILLDLDLAILGTSSDRYQQYVTLIRQEYSWLSDRDFYQGRKRVLQNFLTRTRIYYTDYFYQQLEPQARTNITEEVGLYA